MKRNCNLSKEASFAIVPIIKNHSIFFQKTSFLKILILLFIGFTLPYKSMACDPTSSIELSNLTNNYDGTYDLDIEVCIGDAGSITGIPIVVYGADITAFSPASLTATNTATGSISNGILTYSYPSGTATSDMFAAPNANPCFDITITLDQYPSDLRLTIDNVNDYYNSSCNDASFPDSVSAFIPNFIVSCDADPIYDSGGSTGNYGNNENIEYQVCPTFAGSSITIDFASFDLENGTDILSIYDENGTTTTPTTYTGTNSPGSITATNATGCFTLVFTSDGSGTAAGFEFTTSCPTYCNATFTDPNGAASNYGNNNNETYNICNDIYGFPVTITFTDFLLEEDYDFMYIYDEDGTTSTATAYTHNNSPGTVTATNPSGCLTVVFISDGSVTERGWEATVSCGCDSGSIITASTSVDSEVCPNISPTGTASASGSGGTTPYSYIWEDGSTTQSVNLGTGTYSVTVYDADYCYDITSVTMDVILDLNISGNSTIIPNGDMTPDLDDHTNMGSVLIGNTTTSTFTINNSNANLALDITNATITGDAEFTLGTVSTIIPAGGSVTFDVTYTPTSVGSNSATISITDDCSNTAYTFLVSAEASNIPAEALNFDGTDDFCFANINSPTDFTMEAWIKADPTANGYRAFLVWQKTGANHETSLEVRGTGVVRFGQYDYDNFQFQQIFSTTNVKDGACHHVAGVVSGNQRLLYIDGVLEATLTVNNNNNAAEDLTDLRIGNIQLNNGNLREHFKGDIDEVRIWDYARSCQEIINDMGCELTGAETGLMAYYDFNQGVASGNNPFETTLFDRTGNGYDAALNNFALTTGATSNWIEPGCGSPLATCMPFLGTIAVSGNSQNIQNNDITPDIADDTDFGTINFGASDTHTFTIENSGAADLTVSGITLLGTDAAAFEIDNTLVFPIVIPSLGAQDVAITFLDNACIAGTYLATVNIANDDCDDDPFLFNIQGTKLDMTDPSVICQNATLSPDSDGNVTVSASDVDGGTTDNCSFTLTVSPNTFTCSNTGANTVTLTATDDAGNSSSCTSTVTINATPKGFVR